MQELEAELASRKEVEYEETAHLEKAMEQVEDNLKRSRVNIYFCRESNHHEYIVFLVFLREGL